MCTCPLLALSQSETFFRYNWQLLGSLYFVCWKWQFFNRLCFSTLWGICIMIFRRLRHDCEESRMKNTQQNKIEPRINLIIDLLSIGKIASLMPPDSTHIMMHRLWQVILSSTFQNTSHLIDSITPAIGELHISHEVIYSLWSICKMLQPHILRWVCDVKRPNSCDSSSIQERYNNTTFIQKPHSNYTTTSYDRHTMIVQFEYNPLQRKSWFGNE